MSKISNKEEKIIHHLNGWLENQKVFNNRKEIAKYLSVSQSHFNNICKKRRHPSQSVLNKIAIMTEFDKSLKIVERDNQNNDRPYKDFAVELRKWFNKQQRWKLQKDLTDYLGIDNSTFSKYCTGKSFPRGQIRKKLYDITRIDYLFEEESDIKKESKVIIKSKQESEEINVTINKLIKELESIKIRINENKILLKNRKIKELNHIRFSKAFYQLAREINNIRESDSNEREMLRNLISPKDVGYVSSFLKALFDEDKFSDFILFSKYDFEMEGGIDE